MSIRYVVGDARDVTATIPDGSIDLVMTSPPFLALRSYLPSDHKDKHREIGSEANPAQFLDTLLELTAEWGRVLAPHGTLAVELGDTYSGSGDASGVNDPKWTNRETFRTKGSGVKGNGWPLAKSLACIPQLYAVALAYGINPLTGQPSPAGRYRVRNVIHWHRPNPPVGALGDKWRPASSSITVACRGQRRWFDLDAVRVPSDITGGSTSSANNHGHANDGSTRRPTMPNTGNNGGAPPLDWHTDGDLGTGHIILTTQPYAGSHYATFPMELPRKIIDCMCPRQVCRVCGVASERIVGETRYVAEAGREAVLNMRGERQAENVNQFKVPLTGRRQGHYSAVNDTLGWSDCGHDNYRPGLVLDPFCGTGTTLAAAQDLGRDAIGIDIDEDNAWLARERCGMFATFEHFERPVVDTVEL